MVNSSSFPTGQIPYNPNTDPNSTIPSRSMDENYPKVENNPRALSLIKAGAAFARYIYDTNKFEDIAKPYLDNGFEIVANSKEYFRASAMEHAIAELRASNGNLIGKYREQEKIAELLQYPKDNPHGYIAITLINEEMKVCMTVAMGTAPNVLTAIVKGHYVTDFLLAGDCNTRCHERAIEYAQHVKSTIADPNKYETFYVGHSLGGHIAHLQAAVVGGTAIGIDCPLLTKQFLNQYHGCLQVSYDELKFNPNFLAIQSNPNFINQAGNKNELYGIQLRVDLTGENTPTVTHTLKAHNMTKIYEQVDQGRVFEGKRTDSFCHLGQQISQLIPIQSESLAETLHNPTKTGPLMLNRSQGIETRLQQVHEAEPIPSNQPVVPRQNLTVELQGSREVSENFDPLMPEHQRMLNFTLTNQLQQKVMAIDGISSSEWIFENHDGVNIASKDFVIEGSEFLNETQSFDLNKLNTPEFKSKLIKAVNIPSSANKTITKISVGDINGGYKGINVDLSNGSTVGIGVNIGNALEGAGEGCMAVTVTVKLSQAGLQALLSTATLTTLGVGVVLVSLGATIKYFCDRHDKRVNKNTTNSLKNTGNAIDFILKNVAPQLSDVQSGFLSGDLNSQEAIEKLDAGKKHLNHETNRAEERAEYARSHGKKDALKIHLESIRLQSKIQIDFLKLKTDIETQQQATNACKEFNNYTPENLLKELENLCSKSELSKLDFYLAIEISNLLRDKLQNCNDSIQADQLFKKMTNLKLYAPPDLDLLEFVKGYGYFDENSLKDVSWINDLA